MLKWNYRKQRPNGKAKILRCIATNRSNCSSVYDYALYGAILRGYEDAVRALVDLGAGINGKGSVDPPLVTAWFAINNKMKDLLRELGATDSLRDRTGRNAYCMLMYGRLAPYEWRISRL